MWAGDTRQEKRENQKWIDVEKENDAPIECDIDQVAVATTIDHKLKYTKYIWVDSWVKILS